MIRRADTVIYLTVALNVLASALMLFVLKQATIAEPDDAVRLGYIFEHRTAVALSWGSWVLASLSLVAFFYVLHTRTTGQPRFWSGLALVFAAIGCAPDLISDLISMTIIPAHADLFHADPSADVLRSYRLWDHFSVVLTGGLGNFCYGLGGMILIGSLLRSGVVPRGVAWFGLPVWVLTFGMSLASFQLSAEWLPPVVGATMAWFVLWAALVGLKLRAAP